MCSVCRFVFSLSARAGLMLEREIYVHHWSYVSAFRLVCILTRGVLCGETAGERESVSQEGQTGPSEAPQGFLSH